jgi:predicted aspartyl protease
VILGVVSDQGLPTITLPIAGRDWPATIDTGFNGDLELPDTLRGPLNAQFVGRATAALAGGQSVEEDLYLVDFPFDGRIVQAEATFVSGNRLLIGTRLLHEYTLQINFVSRTVQLERA